jgi:hypothetical protein
MNDKELWLAIRRALLIIVRAIEKKYPTKQVELDSGGQVSVSYLAEEQE